MTAYISCGCNRVPHAADWGVNGLICFGACNAIAIYDPCAGKIGKVRKTLCEHKDRVNIVRWIKRKNGKPESELLSGSVDGTVIIWSKTDDSFESTSILNIDEIVTICNSMYLSNSTENDNQRFTKLLVCTGCITGEMKLWLRDEKGDVKCLQTLPFEKRLPIESCFSYLPNNTIPLLAVALEDASVQLFAQQLSIAEEMSFVKVQTLTGHENWIRCMDFSYDKDGSLLLATGSQDTTIRLWKIVMVPEEEAKKEPKEDFKEESKEESKQESKEESKEEAKKEPKEEANNEAKKEPKEEAKKESKEEPKEESKQESKEESKEEVKEGAKKEPKEESKEQAKEVPKEESMDEAKKKPKKESKEEAKDEPKEESKEELKDKLKEESKNEFKKESQEEAKKESQEEAKKESTEEPKEESKDELKEASKDEFKEESKDELKGESKEEAKKEIKEEPKEEAKKEAKEESKEEAKEELKEESQEEAKKESTEEPKEESKDELKEGSKDEVKVESKDECKKEFQDELHQKKLLFSVDNVKYNITLESVLCGHEGWIYGLNWHPLEEKDGVYHQPMKLLSCSLDKSMIVWEPDAETGIWTEKIRVGDVGGNSLGFYGCKFSPDGLNILAHGYQGSFHIWQYSEASKNWVPRYAPSGHFSEVIDLCWEPKGRFFLTASTDQTTRVHAPWRQGSEEFWHEIGRPQVHGYDMSCLSVLTPYMFASGAEEKVVRIFTAPAAFKSHLVKFADVEDIKCVAAEGAAVPALGLTNKATFETEETMTKEPVVNDISNDGDYVCLNEKELVQDTLWPELQKLYGHGYEIFSMAARHDGTLLATACKATTPEHAAIILWNTETWLEVQRLISHQLTVTQMSFSPNDKYLVSVSKDRKWSLFEYIDGSYILKTCSIKKNSLHSRIIWCCAWTHDSCFFLTGSRDGKIGVWNASLKDAGRLPPMSQIDMKAQSITALALAPLNFAESHYILAVGYEMGCIEIYKFLPRNECCKWDLCKKYDPPQAHHRTVKRLKFRPSECSDNTLQLASCGSDHTVKIYNIPYTDVQ